MGPPGTVGNVPPIVALAAVFPARRAGRIAPPSRPASSIPGASAHDQAQRIRRVVADLELPLQAADPQVVAYQRVEPAELDAAPQRPEPPLERRQAAQE